MKRTNQSDLMSKFPARYSFKNDVTHKSSVRKAQFSETKRKEKIFGREGETQH